MIDKIKEKANDLYNTVMIKLKKKDPNQVEQLGKKLALEDDKKESNLFEQLTSKQSSQEENQQPINHNSSYVGSMEQTTPPTDPPVEAVHESKSDVVDAVKNFVKDVNAPLDKNGDTGDQRRKKLIVKKIKQAVELVVLILLVLMLRNKYISYSNQAKQKLIYNIAPYTYIIDRNAYQFNVTKSVKEECKDKKKECEPKNIKSYNINYSKTQMFAIRVYFDFLFKFKNTEKSITKNNINNDLAERVMWSIITNDADFLSTNRYNHFTIKDYESKSEYKEKGYYYDEIDNKINITVALGIKEYDGYSLKVREIHYLGNEMKIYVEEEEPATDNPWKSKNSPIVTFTIDDKPGSIKVFDISNGESFKYMGHLKGDNNKSSFGDLGDKK